ncbi:MAG: hypothetical protein QNL88_10285 [Acidobacteriota bacterium]|nr:hypothetical protein [Acidobacteriota bacterium]
MKPNTTFEVIADRPALVLYWPVADVGLWDPAVAALVELLEEDLGVFVTYVGSGPGVLAMSDAAAAARFMGCSSLVVVSLEGAHPTVKELEEVSVGCRMPMVATGSEWTASAVAEAYHEACRHVERAA